MTPDELGIKVVLKKKFSIVKETLERMGIVSTKKKKKFIFPSCHILDTTLEHEGEKVYTIVHFKECFALQGKELDVPEVDIARLKTITYFLDKWGLVSVIDPTDISEILHSQVDVISKAEKENYRVVHKYRF